MSQQQQCAADNCKRISRALCHCCQQNLCISHLSEHDDVLNSKLDPLINEVNSLGERLKTLTFHESIDQCRQQLEQWLIYAYTKINQLYEEKCDELENFFTSRLSEQKNNLTVIQSKVTDLVRQQEVTKQDIESIQSVISIIQNELTKIEHTPLRMYACSLTLDENLIQFQEVHEHQLNPETLSTVFKSIRYPPDSAYALAESDRSLLIHQKPNIYFINRDLEITKKLLWSNDAIENICWSRLLNQFIAVTKNKMYLVDENNMRIDTIKLGGNYQWFSCTCSNNKIFLSTAQWGPSIIEVDLAQSPYAISKEWRSPIVCGKNEWINNIASNDKSLCVIITNNTKYSVHVELRSAQTMVCLWTLPVEDFITKELIYRCCSINDNEWIVINRQSNSLIHISADGQIKQTIKYNSTAYRITTFGSDMLAITTDNHLNFHKLN